MSELHKAYAAQPQAVADMALDQGLRRYMLGVYNKVALGLVVAGGLAWLTAGVPEVRDHLFRAVTTPGAPRLVGLTPLGSLVTMSPLLILLGANLALKRPTAASTGLLYWAIVSLVGASLGVLVLTFTGASIATAFLTCAAAFAGLSLMGYATKRDLSGLGSFLIMGLFGLVAALVVNLALHSALVHYVASLAGLLVFGGLTAFETQRLKLGYYQMGGDEAALSIATNYGALNLFLNFINLFQLLLMFMSGDRR
jgi:FtsH-binding integral membrane protein